MEERTNELHSRASAEPSQNPVPAHHRFHHTRLWRIVHGETAIGLSCEESRGAEGENQRSGPPAVGVSTAANGSARMDIVAILDAFLNELQSYCRDEKDLPERMRTLRFTRIGLIAGLFMRTPPESGRNLDISTLVERALDIFDCELKIIDMELEHPELRPVTPATPFDCAPRAQWNGSLAQLLEIIVALFLTGLIRTVDGRPMNLAEIAALFEELFGIKISDLYGRKTRLLMRKKNESPFLDSLLFLYRKEVEKMSL